MKFLKFLVLPTVALLCLVVACTKDNLNQTAPDTSTTTASLKNVRVENGTLHFSEGEAFYAELEQLNALSEAQMDAWEQTHSFKSMRTMQSELISELNREADNGTSIESLKNRYPSKIDFKDGTFRGKVENPVFARIANQQGIYYVGKDLFKIVDNRHLIGIANGDEEKAQRLDLTTTPHAGVVIYPLEQAITLRGGCGTNNTAWQTSTDNTRKVEMSMFVVQVPCCLFCGGVRGLVTVKLAGYKKNIWGNWTDYDTELLFEQAGYEVVNSFGTTVSANNWSGVSAGDVRTYTATQWVDPMPYYGVTSTLSFNKLKARGKSRGTGAGRWASFCCGYLPAQCPL